MMSLVQSRSVRPLVVTSLLFAVLGTATLVGMGVDSRHLGGVSIWLKPMKFFFSLGLYNLTIAWMLGYVSDRPKLTRTVVWTLTVTSVIEMLAIAGQAWRGRQSHFNVEGDNLFVWMAMGFAIVALWIATLVLAVTLLRQKLAEPALAWGIRFGLIVTVLGTAEGFFMTRPTPEQQAEIQQGKVTMSGAHTVGAPDGGPGLPLVNWSTQGGDLRVAHFLGLHALQLLPLVGLWLSRRRGLGLTVRHRVALASTAGLSYLALVLLATWQALRGQPVFAPDALTGYALAGWAVLSAGPWGAVELSAASASAAARRATLSGSP